MSRSTRLPHQRIGRWRPRLEVLESRRVPRAVRGEELNDVESFVHHPTEADGVWISINGGPLRDGDGTPCGGLIVCRDITDRRRVAEALKDAKEVAEAASRSKDQFLAILSHELRTPLTPALLTVSALLDEDAVAGDLRHSLETIRHNIELEARLIDDLLDVARATCGRMSLDLGLMDAHEAIREALAVCRGEIDAGGIRPTLELAAADSHVNADPARLQQVLWNLIKNAAKFTPRGGWLAIRTRNEQGAPGDSPGARLVIEVSDSGIGIEPEVLPRIFDPFEQGSDTLRRRYGGLGLGLAIGRSVIDAHGGRLTASSAGRDRGSTFTLELMTISGPAPAAPAPPSTPHEATRPRSLRILLVEDNKETLRCLTAILGRSHAVRSAAMLSSALELATTEEFDLVLSDIELPDGTGLELMQELRKRRATPGIAMSGFGSEEDIRLSRSAGFAEHLTKPIDTRSLEAVIRRVAGHASGGRPERPHPEHEPTPPLLDQGSLVTGRGSPTCGVRAIPAASDDPREAGIEAGGSEEQEDDRVPNCLSFARRDGVGCAQGLSRPVTTAAEGHRP